MKINFVLSHNLVGIFLSKMTKAYPARSTRALVPDLPESGAVGPLFPGVKILWEIVPKLRAADEVLFRWKGVRLMIWVHSHQAAEVRGGHILVEVSSRLEISAGVIIAVSNYFVKNSHLPGRIDGIYVVDVFVGQGMGFVC